MSARYFKFVITQGKQAQTVLYELKILGNPVFTYEQAVKYDEPVAKLTVTFDSNGGTSVAPIKVKPGTAAAAPTPPAKVGYTFVEWQLNGAAFDFATPITTDLQLKAVWKLNATPTTPTPTPTPTPEPETDTKAVVTADQFKPQGENGNVSVTVKAGVTDIELPVNSGELLQGKLLELHTGDVTLFADACASGAVEERLV
ncbi:InlB B-repeat-containing protein [Cohnella faecalis]|uniref:Bacterial repeat domain-containing protein n=1 Tax=Cohnella faecalis TaxID=2315694 RepID=A0A398CDB0_9BACL|nr:InlB B-repeat-containing protein [Cohnella faecalis]RIE00683.1 hypothetical protein D3H35_27380 [Cohnella faecalis]